MSKQRGKELADKLGIQTNIDMLQFAIGALSDLSDASVLANEHLERLVTLVSPALPQAARDELYPSRMRYVLPGPTGAAELVWDYSDHEATVRLELGGGLCVWMARLNVHD
jgi:hypothetical protein